jgi:hypothetical protein
MEDPFSWNLSAEEEIKTTTDDRVFLSSVCKRGHDGVIALDLAPHFRYILRVSGMTTHNCQKVAADFLYKHSLMLMPFEVEGSIVLEVVVLNLSPKVVRISHQPSQAEVLSLGAPSEDAVRALYRKSEWTSPSYNKSQHHNGRGSPHMRPQTHVFSKSEAQKTSEEPMVEGEL